MRRPERDCRQSSQFKGSNSKDEDEDQHISTPELIAEAKSLGFSVQDLQQAENELKVLFKGTHWLRLWAKLQQSEERTQIIVEGC
ncbi:hypothetical protein U9M48_035309 [Paspalum notatum var. saurae]|uniref:Uncharacterized protein n=1 Tax=Paspalum notatum var. saurae TaxID=547442 RepID=A0AAQ3UGU9_PASNO